MLKRITILIMSLIFSVLLFGCAQRSSQTNQVVLCDYKNIEIPCSAYDISKTEIDTALSMYAYATELDINDSQELTDDIVKEYIGYSNITELKEVALYNMIYHRIFDYVYEEILSDSKMCLNDVTEFYDFYNMKLNLIDNQADAIGLSRLEYIENEYQMTEKAYEEYELDFFVTTKLLQELLNQEKCAITSNEIMQKRLEYACEESCNVEETYNYLTDFEILYILEEEKISGLISDWYNNKIDAVFYDTKNTLGI